MDRGCKGGGVGGGGGGGKEEGGGTKRWRERGREGEGSKGERRGG